MVCMAELKLCVAELILVLFDFCLWVGGSMVCMAELKPAHAAPDPHKMEWGGDSGHYSAICLVAHCIVVCSGHT